MTIRRAGGPLRRRAGADLILTYFAREAARRLRQREQ